MYLFFYQLIFHTVDCLTKLRRIQRQTRSTRNHNTPLGFINISTVLKVINSNNSFLNTLLYTLYFIIETAVKDKKLFDNGYCF